MLYGLELGLQRRFLKCHGAYEMFQELKLLFQTHAHVERYETFYKYFGVFGEGTLLAISKTNCAPDSSSLKPGSGATEGVLDKGVSGQPDYILLVELLDYEDTRLKTSSRVRVGLSFAWKASLAIRICRFPSL